MSLRTLACAAGIALIMGGPALAVTKGLTENRRALVDGTTSTGTDVSLIADPAGLMLGTVGLGATEFSQIDLHGHISLDSADYYSFTATTAFTIEFLFDGVFVSGSEINSGFVRARDPENSSLFSLALNGTTDSTLYSTNVVDPSQNGGTSLIFSGLAGGLYTFGVNSGVSEPDGVALYDIRISAVEPAVSSVPLPAGLPLLLAGLAGLGLVARRRARA